MTHFYGHIDLLNQLLKVLRCHGRYSTLHGTVHTKEGNNILDIAIYFCGDSDMGALLLKNLDILVYVSMQSYIVNGPLTY
jgi:hypothetical protein